MAMAPRWGGWEGWRLSVGRVKGDLLRMVQSGACQRDWCSGRAWWAGCMGSGVSVFVVVHVCPLRCRAEDIASLASQLRSAELS